MLEKPRWLLHRTPGCEGFFLPAALLPNPHRSICNTAFSGTAVWPGPLPASVMSLGIFACRETGDTRDRRLPPGGLRQLQENTFFFLFKFYFKRWWGRTHCRQEAGREGSILLSCAEGKNKLMVLLQEMHYSLGASREVAGHLLVRKIINQLSFSDTRENVWHSSVAVIEKLICCGRQSQL